MRKELEDLKAQLAEMQKTNSVDEQLLLMEKSYELAAKYMPVSSNKSVVEMQKPKASILERCNVNDHLLFDN